VIILNLIVLTKRLRYAVVDTCLAGPIRFRRKACAEIRGSTHSAKVKVVLLSHY